MPKKGKDPKEALKHTAIATLKGGAYSYGIAFGCSLLGGMMQNSTNKVIQSFGKSSLPVMIVGAALSEVFFNALNSKKVELAHQRRIEIEKECRESIRLLEMYRNQFKEVFERYFHGTIKFFNESFDELERVLYAGDADLVIGANNKIQEGLGQKALFGNKQECWNFITSHGRTEI
ncbi:hypothetical protein [Helicobacter pylori]|uniref:hypothetical protein n=1 Tax=Helicobacter pylori TaxID=210 RepID=UPI0005041DD4|nr:hypothetical protein [Helicobacter pylori]KFH28505.1 hypothetical protein JM69_00115 [Helicobacter pylori]